MEQQLKERRRGQSLRRNQTKEENQLWYHFLKTHPMQFRRQYQIGSYYVDFYCYRAKLVVELDGSQHCTPEGITYDQSRTAFLGEKGLKVLRFSNLDIWRNFRGICEVIDAAVKEGLLHGEDSYEG